MSPVFVLCDDLLFSSRISATARSLGISSRIAGNQQSLKTMLISEVPTCVIVDLHNPGLDIAEVVREVKKLAPAPRVVGFGSHVDTATLKAARDAGCDVVWPRSKFAEELEIVLPQWTASASAEGIRRVSGF